jgi:queuosine precursor transporter
MHKNDNWQPRYLMHITVALAASFLTTNILAFKVVEIFGFRFGASAIFFPISLIIGDVLSEVYGYKRARFAILLGLCAYLYFMLVSLATVALPAAPQWAFQTEYEKIFGFAPRVFIAGCCGYICGELSNAYIMSRMKVWQKGKNFWFRAMVSTFVGELLHTSIGAPIVFFNILSGKELIALIITATCIKIVVEAMVLPFTTILVKKLKNLEEIDFYDSAKSTVAIK